MKFTKSIRKLGLTTSILLGSIAVQEANAELSIFSRANCYNNESISWDAWSGHTLKTISDHVIIDGGYDDFHCKFGSDVPDFTTGPTATECIGEAQYVTGSGLLAGRSGAVHYAEPTGLLPLVTWQVFGTHYQLKDVGEVFLGVTSATDCLFNSITELYDQFFG